LRQPLVRVQARGLERFGESWPTPTTRGAVSKERTQALHMKRDCRATPTRATRQVRGHVIERGLGPGARALGLPGEKRTKRTAVILERRRRESALVTQRAQQILERVIA
jgi:hypothetical protein